MNNWILIPSKPCSRVSLFMCLVFFCLFALCSIRFSVCLPTGNRIWWMTIVFSGSGRSLGDVSSSSSSGMGVGSGSGSGTGGLPTVVVIALAVGAAVVLVLMCGVTYYFRSERRMRARKEGVASSVGHHQRHHLREIKDPSLTAPCLPRGSGDHPPPTQPPQPPESATIHHRYQPPPSCMPYSVSLRSVLIHFTRFFFLFFDFIFYGSAANCAYTCETNKKYSAGLSYLPLYPFSFFKYFNDLKFCCWINITH